jgi:hypothetical protein
MRLDVVPTASVGSVSRRTNTLRRRTGLLGSVVDISWKDSSTTASLRADTEDTDVGVAVPESSGGVGALRTRRRREPLLHHLRRAGELLPLGEAPTPVSTSGAMTTTEGVVAVAEGEEADATCP